MGQVLKQYIANVVFILGDMGRLQDAGLVTASEVSKSNQ
jgi:hypothetical protein